jgi:hypothetical protein
MSNRTLMRLFSSARLPETEAGQRRFWGNGDARADLKWHLAEVSAASIRTERACIGVIHVFNDRIPSRPLIGENYPQGTDNLKDDPGISIPGEVDAPEFVDAVRPAKSLVATTWLSILWRCLLPAPPFCLPNPS